jgi:CheY-like chemotaxis protein
MTLISLIAEENSSVHYLLKTYAQMCGFETVHATVGERALELVRQFSPVFVLLNVDLPGKVRGWEVLACLKNEEATRDLPVVIYRLDEGSAQPQPALEADACLQIPILYEGFRDTLSQAGIEIQDPPGSPAPRAERRAPRK